MYMESVCELDSSAIATQIAIETRTDCQPLAIDGTAHSVLTRGVMLNVTTASRISR